MNEEKEDPILAAPQPNELDDDKPTLNFDQRQTLLFNNPNYGVVLCFLEHFRSFFDLDDYPFGQLEENLLNDQENSQTKPFSLLLNANASSSCRF